jgi:FKBP-type peptidyl-prolyl cis-trans isomerase FkpA/FKBP-type peptidyl-prolyl cis-trans isomerase FklB
MNKTMKKVSVFMAATVVALGVSATSCDSKKSANLKSGLDSASYAIGIANGAMFAQSLENFPGDPINVDLLLSGLEAAMKKDTGAMKMTDSQAQAFIQNYFMQVQAQEGSKTKEEGDKFLAENKTKDGVISTESGLQYKVITEGTGEKPVAEDRVKVHYTGTLLDGTKFDSSLDRGEPAIFGVSQVIAGWTEGLQIMPIGSKYTFWIPSDLAYGERGTQNIKPNSVLQFEVELLEIVKE